MSATVRDKAAYHRQTDERINRHFESPGWSVRQKLALACRILAMEGHDSGLAGQVTARGPNPHSGRACRPSFVRWVTAVIVSDPIRSDFF